MRNCVIGCLVLCSVAGMALGQTNEPPKKATVDLGGGLKLEMTLIPAGEFEMGSPPHEDEKNRSDDEYPLHRVRITKPFYLGTYHVTLGQFRQFVTDTGYKTDAEKGRYPGAWGWNPDKKEFGSNGKYCWRTVGFEQSDEHPVVNVSWNDAEAFCKWLGKKEGKAYRLPTEAEWEYACRAGTTTRYSSGDDPETLAEVANVADATAAAKFPDWKYTIKASDGYVFTAPVGQFSPNAFGLYDMHGNTWQWCADWYGEKYYIASPVDDPGGPETGLYRVYRGGSWINCARFCRSAYRDGGTPGFRSDYLGFRVAQLPADKKP